MGNAAVERLAEFGGAGGLNLGRTSQAELVELGGGDFAARRATPGGLVLDYLFDEAYWFPPVRPEEAASVRSLTVCRGWHSLFVEWRAAPGGGLFDDPL